MGSCLRTPLAQDTPHQIVQELPPLDPATDRSTRSLFARLFRNQQLAEPAAAAESLELQLVESRPDEECPICMDPLLSNCVATKCGHYFHESCLTEYAVVSRLESPGSRSTRCPLCRSPMRLPLPVEATSTSGRPIEVGPVPRPGQRCHYDRRYQFLNLGSFARDRMLYVCTSNDDRKTPSDRVMWALHTTVPVIVHMNFRSETHAQSADSNWLSAWEENRVLESTVSSGIPNGPYTGPVYSKAFQPGTIELMGSGCWQGTYFVFVEVVEEQNTAAVPEEQNTAAFQAELTVD